MSDPQEQSAESVLLAVHDGVATVTINRPGARNALNESRNFMTSA